MIFFIFYYLSTSVFTEDPSSTLKKISTILEYIKERKIINFIPAENAIYSVQRQAEQIDVSTIHSIPSKVVNCTKLNEDEFIDDSNCLIWKDFHADVDFSFPSDVQYKSVLFQGDLQFDKDTLHKFNTSEYIFFFDFLIKRKFIGGQWADSFPAGPEGRIWLNGKPFGAIDEFHNGASLPELGHVELRIFTGRTMSEHVLEKFGISIVHKETESLYQRIRFTLDILKELSANESYEYYQILTILDKTVRMLDISEWSNFKLPLIRKLSENEDLSYSGFYSTVHDSLKYLKESFDSLPKPTESDPAISVIGYSHIDTCWMWPFNITRSKILNTATSMLRLININKQKGFTTRFSEYKENEFKWKFLATSAQHYKWIKEDDPELFSNIIKEIINGRWEANGATWVEPDTNLPSGESLVRQIVMGTRFFDKEVNRINSTFHFNQTVLFLPDCFGYSANLPQIMRKSGLKYFVTSKISWSEYTSFPHSTFKWRGIDGSDVLSHFVSTPTKWNPKQSTYTGQSTAYELINTYTNYKQKDLLPTSAFHTSGNGDGGGGINEKMMINLNIMNELPRIQKVPRLKSPSLTEMFEIINDKENELPIWDDELYLEYHRGTFTSQEEIKRQNRQLESLLHTCEWLSVILFTLLDIREIETIKEIEMAWEDALLFQFHDALPGSSINEVNNDILNRGKKVLNGLFSIQCGLSNFISMATFENNSNHSIVFNTLSHERKFAGQILPSGGWSVYESLNEIQYDKTETSFYELKKGSKYGIKMIQTDFVSTTLNTNLNSSQKVEIIKKLEGFIEVKTPFLSIVFNSNGTIESVKDVKTGRQFVSSPCNLFELYEDRPPMYAAWDIPLFHKEMQLFEGIQFEGYEIISSTSLKARYSIRSFKKSSSENYSSELRTSSIIQTITFSEDSPFIDFKTVVNWTEHDKLLKVAFPTTIRSKFARFGIQFGHITRPTHKNTLRDFAKFETCGRWADLSDSNGGFAILSDIKSGFDVHENIVRMSLLKAPMDPDKWADFGIRKFSYRCVFHSAPFENSKIPLLSDELVYHVAISESSESLKSQFDSLDFGKIKKLPKNAEFVKVNADQIVIETLKLSFDNEKAFVARVYESNGGWIKGKISFPMLVSKMWNVEVVDLLEKKVENANNVNKIENNDFLEIEVELKPFELLSIMFTKI